MGHRRFLGSSQLFYDEHDQGWNHVHPEHPYTSLAISGATENISHVYPVENMLSEGMPVSSHWNSSSGPNTYTAPGHSVERQHYNLAVSGPSHDPFMSSIVATLYAPNENFVTFPSSSNCNDQTWSNASYADQSMENVRESQKRKSPCDSSIYEIGSSSQYRGDRATSNIHFPPELPLRKSMTHDHDPHYMPWLMNPNYRSHNLSIRGEGSSRYVRNRPTFDLEANLDGNNLPRTPSLDSHSTHHYVEHSGSSRFPGQTSHGNKDWNYHRLFPVQGYINAFSPYTNNFLPARSGVSSTSVDTIGYHHHGVIENRNSTVAHGFPGTSTQPANSSRFSHRSTPTYRSSSNGLGLGHVTSSFGDMSHLLTETYPSRHLRISPYIVWRIGDRTGRRKSSYEKFQPPFDEVALHEWYLSEGFIVVDRNRTTDPETCLITTET